MIPAHPVGVNDVAAREHWDRVFVHVTRYLAERHEPIRAESPLVTGGNTGAH
jgi:hypothetical protein